MSDRLLPSNFARDGARTKTQHKSKRDLRLPLGDVAAVVGHDDIRTTESYREPDEEMVRHRLSGLAAVMFSPEDRCFPSVSGTVAVRSAPSDR